MTLEQAQLYSEQFYDDHPAAVPLLLEWVNGSTAGARSRAALALALLDPAVPLIVAGADYLRRLLGADSAAHLAEQERRRVERWAAMYPFIISKFGDDATDGKRTVAGAAADLVQTCTGSMVGA